jgi:hypothetical protein
MRAQHPTKMMSSSRPEIEPGMKQQKQNNKSRRAELN